MSLFDKTYDEWLQKNISEEQNPRRSELLKKGLGHGIIELLRYIWYPAIGNLDYLYPEFEVRDFNNKCRYIDIAYMPHGAKGCVEVHGFRSHARDIEVSRFKDLCMKQAMLGLDQWLFLPIAYLSIKEEPEMCKQMVLSFVGTFLSTSAPIELNWAEAETLRFARRMIRPFTPQELSAHLRITDRHARNVLKALLDKKMLVVASGNQRYRTYRLP